MGTQRLSRNTPQVRYHVLNRRRLALFQSRFRLASFNETITIACVGLFFKILRLLHTGLETRSWRRSGMSSRVPGPRTGAEVESQICPGFLGAAPALRAPSSPTAAPALLSTCLVFLFLIHADSKATGAQANSASQSQIRRGSRDQKELK